MLGTRASRPHAPLLWMNHVRPLQTTWPLAGHKPEYIQHQDAGAILLPNKNYVLIRRFSAKEESRRLTAAPHFSKTLSGRGEAHGAAS